MKDIAKVDQNLFESIKHLDEKTGAEYWSARELMKSLGYNEWRNFESVIRKARNAAKNSYYNINDHFGHLTKVVEVGNDSVREITDYRLSRYACYLIAMSGDSKKPNIAHAQTYFAQSTRKQELADERAKLEKRITAREEYRQYDKILSGTVLNHGVDRKGLAKIKSNGDAVLFGGHDTRAMKKKFGLSDRQNLPDHLPSVTLAAKRLADEITAHNTEANNLYGDTPIGHEHNTNNQYVRRTLLDRGIKPETLPPEEDIKRAKRRLAAKDMKKLSSGSRGARA